MERRTTSSTEPLYAQVLSTLKAEILKGVHPVGARLPAEDLLADRFSVSRHTIREALRRLRDDGLIESRRGAPTTVMRPTPGRGGGYVHEIASINDLFSFSSALRFRVATIKSVTMKAALAKRIGCQAGEKWLRVEGFRYPAAKEVPVCWMEVFIHEDYAGVARLLDHNQGTIFELIETLYGERIDEVRQTLRMSPMPDQAAPALRVQPGETSVEVTRVFQVASGKTVEASVSHFPTSDFTFSMTLRRSR